MRIAVGFHRLGPYHHARLQAAAARGIDVHALEFYRAGGAYRWRPLADTGAYPRTTLFDDAAAPGPEPAALRRRVVDVLDAMAPDVLAIPGWAEPISLMMLRHGMQRGWPAIVMSESTRDDASRRWWREAIKRRLVALCGAALVGGTRQRAYMRDLGLDDDAIADGYDAVDNAYFARAADQARARAAELRARHGLPPAFFLASSRFVTTKNLLRLIEAYAAYRRTAADAGAWPLVLLGDGPMGEAIRGEIRRFGLETAVILPGFRQYDELPVYYGLASAFVHASTVEPWGLVVNEAMASGLPVVVSSRCGCARDLVREGENGFAFDPEDAPGLGALLARVAELPARERAMMAAAGRAIIAAWGPERFAEGLLRAAIRAAAGTRKPAGPADRALLHGLAAWSRRAGPPAAIAAGAAPERC